MSKIMMDEAIRDFPKQFLYEPVIEGGALSRHAEAVFAGMGGSHLAGDILKMARPELALTVYSDYGLPAFVGSVSDRDCLIIASSYSGNTEEAIDTAERAFAERRSLLVITTGGALWNFAETRGIPRIKIPATGIQPRSALGFSLRALLKALHDEEGLAETRALAVQLDVARAEIVGRSLAVKLKGKIPLIYASTQNGPIALNWKIKLNETGKIAAFYNVFPELSHNEMTGFDVIETTRPFAENFVFILLADRADDERIQKRMTITQAMLEERGLPVEALILEGQSSWEKIFQSLLVADWTAYYLAKSYGAEPEAVPMVEELKRRMSNQES